MSQSFHQVKSEIEKIFIKYKYSMCAYNIPFLKSVNVPLLLLLIRLFSEGSIIFVNDISKPFLLKSIPASN